MVTARQRRVRASAASGADISAPEAMVTACQRRVRASAASGAGADISAPEAMVGATRFGAEMLGHRPSSPRQKPWSPPGERHLQG
jgi:hypothetical protein